MLERIWEHKDGFALSCFLPCQSIQRLLVSFICVLLFLTSEWFSSLLWEQRLHHWKQVRKNWICKSRKTLGGFRNTQLWKPWVGSSWQWSWQLSRGLDRGDDFCVSYSVIHILFPRFSKITFLKFDIREA